MKKITGKKKLAFYACSGLGVNMLNVIVGSYLCSALLIGGFAEEDIGRWTYLDKDLVIAALWGVLVIASKVVDGLIDLPFSHFIDNLKTRWGRKKPAILIGYIPMIIAYLLFLVVPSPNAGVLNTIWFSALLCIFYGCYTMTMLGFYSTFAEVAENEGDLVFLSNAKSVCDVVYFSLNFALVPLFVSLGLNIKIVALIFLPLALTMLIPLFMLKEDKAAILAEKKEKKRTTVLQSIAFAFKDKPFIQWLFVLCIMNMGLQLFLSGINEYFSTTDINMTFVMASCFVPVPFTILIYNKLVRKRGLGFAYRYILIVYSTGMALMGLCRFIPTGVLLPYAIMCSIIVSFAIGSFFSVTYTVPSQRALLRQKESKAASSMYFAIQGLFEAVSAGIATGGILVFLKQYDLVSYLTLVVAAFCMTACILSFFLPKTITLMGKDEK